MGAPHTGKGSPHRRRPWMSVLKVNIPSSTTSPSSPAFSLLRQCTKTRGTALYQTSNSTSEAHRRTWDGGVPSHFCNNQMLVQLPLPLPLPCFLLHVLASRLWAQLSLTCVYCVGDCQWCRCSRATRGSIRRSVRVQFASRTDSRPPCQIILGLLRHCQGTAPQGCRSEEEKEEQKE